jgi:pteridine reductase
MTRESSVDVPRRALVTGAARRVGRAIALELANAGWDVAVHYHTSEEEATAVVAAIAAMGRRATALAGDLEDMAVPAKLVSETCSRLGGLDVLVNNASIFEDEPSGGFDAAHWQRTFGINVTACAALIDAAGAALGASGRGRVVNLCDVTAEQPWSSHAAYCASKAALVNLTRSAARRLAPRVTVNGVAPGIAVFPEDYNAAQRERLIAKVPLQRSGTPEDIAAAVRYLVERGGYVTGQVLYVDGGRRIA